MAKKSPVSLKDLIERQRELAAAGDANAAKQLTRLEDLAKETKAQTAILQDIRSSQPAPRLAVETEKILKQDRILQVVQTLEARKADKDDDRIAAATESLDEIARKGLIDKTGDGLNANVLNLLKVMSKFTSGVVPPAGINPPETRRESAPERIPESQRGKQGATGYAKQQIKLQTLDRVTSQGDKGRLGAIGYAKQEFKKLGTLSGWFNTSSEKGQGLLGQAVMRQEAKNDFVKDQLATGATTNKDLAGKRFDKVNELRLQGGDLEKEVADMRARGLSEAQIERTGVVKKQQAVDEKLAIANPLYREIRAAETNAVVPVRGNVKPAESNTSAPNNSPLPELSVPGLAAPVSPVSPAEQSAENLRLMVDQTESIKQIALNTQPIGDILNFLQGSKSKQDTQPAGDGGQDSGSILDMIPGKGILRKGGQILRRAGKGIVSAGLAIASRAAPILSQAGGAIVSGASNIASKAAPVVSSVVSKAGGILGTAAEAGGSLLSKVAPVASTAGGFLGKVGGLAKGVLGKAALPLAAGMAVYDGVTGYRDAAENLGIEGREATTGEKASSAAGSVVSGLTFGLLDKKTASKGIASFFGAGAAEVPKTKQYASDNDLARLDEQLVKIQTRDKLPADERAARIRDNLATAPEPRSADVVYNKSGENAAAAQQAPVSAPVIINAPSTSSVQQTQNYAPMSPPRNTESSLQQYNRSRFAF